MERTIDPDKSGFFASFVDFIEGAEVVDEDTVRITTDYPFSLVNERLSVIKIVPQAAVEADEEAFGAQPIGTGPYELISAVPDDKLVFERFDDYNGPRPALAAGMNWQLLADPAARATAMTSSTIMAMEDVPYIDVDGMSQSVHVDTAQSFGLLFMMFNTAQEPFDDVRVRQAFFYALDMDTIIETGLLGNAAPATSFLPENHASYNEASTVYTYDPDKAQQLLADAGVEDLSITLMTTDTGWVKEIAPLLKESLDAVGINTTLDIGPGRRAPALPDAGARDHPGGPPRRAAGGRARQGRGRAPVGGGSGVGAVARHGAAVPSPGHGAGRRRGGLAPAAGRLLPTHLGPQARGPDRHLSPPRGCR